MAQITLIFIALIMTGWTFANLVLWVAHPEPGDKANAIIGFGLATTAWLALYLI